MTTPFDAAVEEIKRQRYHNHRMEVHSNVISDGILHDLRGCCIPLRDDLDSGKVCYWKNVKSPGGRGRRIDLLVGEPRPGGEPDLSKIRIAVENKSVITAHRNRTSRFDDLNGSLDVIYGAKQEAVIVATVLIGLAERVLNIPDRIKPNYEGREMEFQANVLPRLSSGDQSLWKDFKYAISKNRPDDPKKTLELFRDLPRREIAFTHRLGYDYVLLVPVYIDNVSQPYVARSNNLGIAIDKEYTEMLNRICTAYAKRWR